MAQAALDGTRFDVLGAGGPFVVLVHGLGLNRQAWRWQTEALSGHFRVVTYDLYGHGESPSPPDTPSLSLFSSQLLGLLNHLKIDTAALAGFSLGGMIARRFAMDHRDRLWALAILHSAHQRDAPAHDAIQARVHQARREGPKATVEAALQRWFTDDFRDAQPDIMDDVRRWILANRPDVYASIYQVLVDGVKELIFPNPPISVPTLVMTGGEDYGNSPEMSRSIAAEILGARLVILEGLRHMALAESPDVFNTELLSFLKGVMHDG